MKSLHERASVPISICNLVIFFKIANIKFAEVVLSHLKDLLETITTIFLMTVKQLVDYRPS